MNNKFFIFIFLIAVVSFPGVFADTVTIRPDANGFYSAWNNYGCNSSSEFDCVDDISVASDHLASSSNNIRETFNFTNSGLTSESVNSLTIYYFAKIISGNKKNIQTLIRSGGVDFFGSNFTLNGSYEYYSQIYTTNPATGLAWTVAEVDALESGMRTSTSQGGGNITQIYSVVDYISLPDLIIGSLTLSQSSAFEGEVVTVTVVTNNTGLGNAGASTTRVANGGNHDFSVSALSSGASQTNNFNYTCGASNATFTGTADVFGVVSENNEGNNQLSKVLECKVQQLPDLVIYNITFLEYLDANNTLRVNVTTIVKNIGSATAGTSTTSTVGIGTVNFTTPSLTSNQIASHVRDYQCLFAHNFTATADYLNNVAELSESNNQRVTTIDCIL